MENESSRVSWDGWFSLEIPKEWDSNEDDGVITLFDEEHGVGAIQISVCRRERTTALEEDARKFSTSHLAEAVRGQEGPEVVNREFGARGTVTYIDQDGSCWRVWVVVAKDRIATITYNCADADKNVEEATVHRVVDSFAWED